jgi:hypothetical protein
MHRLLSQLWLNCEQCLTSITFRIWQVERINGEMFVGQGNMTKPRQSERAKFFIFRRRACLSERHRVHMEIAVPGVKHVRGELHIDPIICRHQAFFQGNGFEDQSGIKHGFNLAQVEAGRNSFCAVQQETITV